MQLNAPATQEEIDFIMANFNFMKVAKAMKQMDWKWFVGYANGNPVEIDEVPSEDRIRKKALDLLQEMRGNYISSGGFVATRDKYGLHLKFVVEQCSATHLF